MHICSGTNSVTGNPSRLAVMLWPPCLSLGVKQASLRKTASAYYPSHESAIMGSESSGESLATVPSIKALSTSQESLLSLSDVEVGMERGGEGEREEGERQEEETEEQIMSLRFMEETDGASGKNKVSLQWW